MIIARVFPRRTRATPTDALAFVGPPKRVDYEKGIERVEISVSFSWDSVKALQLAEKWRRIAPVEVDGPAFLRKGGPFEPGRFLRHGLTITSRGCPNKCWFCEVPQREGSLRELPIKPGWIVSDDNFLACSEPHIVAVLEMLKTQPERARFTGGLEAAILTRRKAELLRTIRPKALYFAYDTPNDREPLFEAGKTLLSVGFTKTSHQLNSYCLIGYPGDTFEKAEARLVDCWRAGFVPYAMLWRNIDGDAKPDWREFQRHWVRPCFLFPKLKKLGP